MSHDDDIAPSVSFFSTLRLLFHVLWKANLFFFISLLILALLSGTLSPLTLLINATLLDLIVRSVSAPSAIPGLTEQIVFQLLLFAGITLGGQLLARLRRYIEDVYQKKVTHFISLLIAEKASQLDLAFFENPAFHNRLSNASNEASFRPITILSQLLTLCSTGISVIGVSVLLFQWQPWIVLLVILVSSIRYLLTVRQGKARVKLTLEQTPLQRKAQYTNTVLTSDLYAKEVRLFGLAPWLLKRYRQQLENLYQHIHKHERQHLIVSLVSEPILTLVRPALVAYTVVQVIQRAISVGHFSLYTQSIGQLDTGFFTIINTGAQLHEKMLFLANLATFLQYMPTIEQPRSPLLSIDSTTISAPVLEFRDVSFSYPDTTKPILKQISFRIAPGETAALVGKNGAGKTTLIKLLAGLYEPTEGQILLNGTDISTLDRLELRAYLSVIFQDYALYHLSAADNIGLGQIGGIEDRLRIEQAAERSGFATVIQGFAKQYETVLGRFIERGQELSGGQRQLLALSRALMRESPVLILDEPGAALDIENELAFFRRLFSSQHEHQQTILFISHRFSTVQQAEHILVLEEGQLIEEGTHEQLMQKNGHYTRLFAMQMNAYTRWSSRRIEKENLT